MQENKLKHIVALDGLRGIAVLLVMFYHFVHLPEVSGNKTDLQFNNVLLSGWVGVDLFFVLSGFLITRILINSKDSPSYFSSFYLKRFLRIFPLYYLYLLISFCIVLPYSYAHLNGAEQAKVLVAQHSQVWFWLYLSNIKQMFNGVFFGAGVGHLWSLAIEEQFYIMWPLIIYFFPLNTVKKIAAAIIGGALLLRIIMAFMHVDPQLIYVFTFTRIDALALGTLVAILSMQGYAFNFKKIKTAIPVLVLLSVIILYFFGPRAEHHPVMYTVGLSVFGICFALVIALLQSATPFRFRGIFSSRLFVFLGKYSYALYIFHPLVRQVLMRFMGNPKVIMGTQVPWELMFILIGCLVSVGVALLSWNLYEKWFLKLKKRIAIVPDEPQKLVQPNP